MHSIMFTREGLWQRVAGAPLFRSLPWALAASCALPWCLPETWNGDIPKGLFALGWGLACAALGLLFFRHGRPFGLIVLLAWITLLGLRHRAQWESHLPAGYLEMEGCVDAPWSIQGELRVGRIQLSAPETLKGMDLPVSLPLEGEPAPAPGTPVRFRGELKVVEPAPNFIAERPRWRARSDGSPRRLRLRSAQLLEVMGPARPSALLRLQIFVRRKFDALPLDGTARDLWGALTLGIQPARDEVFSAFAESGTIHTLVVSGLQVTLVMAFLEALWRRTGRRGSTVASALTGLLYCAIVGFSAPVWRGLLMGLAWCLGRGSGWKSPPTLSLHGALLLWLLTHPAAGCEPGFLLAWMALLGVLWDAEPLAGLMSPLLGRWAMPLARLAAPWLTTLPLLALFHGGAPLWGVAANLLVLPLVAFLTPLCLGLTLLPIHPLIHLIAKILTWTGEQGVPFFAQIRPLGTGILWPWMLLVLGWIWLAQRHAGLKRTRALSFLLCSASIGLLLSHGTGRSPRTFSLEAMDIGQGDALLIRQPDGDATLVDTGPSPWAARRIARILSRRGVREPVHLIITHPHGDHAGGWATLARIWPLASTSVPKTALPEDRWMPMANASMLAQSQQLLRGEEWLRGASAFSVRWPPKPFNLPDPNMVSLVLRIRWKDREVWLMGDSLSIQERDLLDLGDPGTTSPHRLLKPGHHGSRSACDPAWIQALHPEAAILTAGRENRFEFPHPETLETLHSSGCREIWIVGTSRGVRVEATPTGWAQ